MRETKMHKVEMKSREKHRRDTDKRAWKSRLTTQQDTEP